MKTYQFCRRQLALGLGFLFMALLLSMNQVQQQREALAPTTRNADIPYDPEESLCLTIDGFIISDNIELVSYSTVDTQFAWSDHNPVQLTFRLLEG